MVPSIPSGRVASFPWFNVVPGDGNVPMALTDFRDIGDWTVRIITDSRTLNRMVFAYTEVITINEMLSTMSKLSGEKVELPYVSGYIPG